MIAEVATQHTRSRRSAKFSDSASHRRSLRRQSGFRFALSLDAKRRIRRRERENSTARTLSRSRGVRTRDHVDAAPAQRRCRMGRQSHSKRAGPCGGTYLMASRARTLRATMRQGVVKNDVPSVASASRWHERPASKRAHPRGLLNASSASKPAGSARGTETSPIVGNDIAWDVVDHSKTPNARTMGSMSPKPCDFTFIICPK